MLRVAEHWCGTDTGLQRRANEDSLLVRSPLFVVADGMGGAQAGEVASRVAVEAFREGLGDSSDVERSLVAQVQQANAHINDLSHRSAEHAGMGTTITAAYVGEREVSVAHVGDSRAYCLRAGELLRLTDDHSLVDELIREGKLTPEEAEEHPQRSVITRALGPEATVEVDVRSFRGSAGDLYLICSDGLTTMVGEHELLELLLEHDTLRGGGEALIAAANAAGGKDNITVVLFRLEDLPLDGELPADGNTATATLAPAPQAALGVGGTTQPPHHGRRPSVTLPPEYELARFGRGPAASSAHRRPRPPQAARGARARRGLRHWRGSLIALVVLGLLLCAGYLRCSRCTSSAPTSAGS